MGHADFLAQRWLGEFLKARGMSVPSGAPLYSYGSSAAELARAEGFLRKGLEPGERLGTGICAAFCLYASEWLRRNYAGGPWSWDPVFGSLGHSQDEVNPRELAQRGLEFWRRPVHRHPGRRLFLVSMVLEGGLPLLVVRSGKGRFATYLKRVLWDLSRYDRRESVAPEIAASHAGMIPSRFRHPELYALVGGLVCSVLAHREVLPVKEDPISWLDTNRPGWRSDFPLPVDDDDARALLAGLIRESASIGAKGARLSSLVERVLEDVGGRHALRLAFMLSGELDAGALPDNVRAWLGDARRARLFADERMGFDGPLALLRREQREHGEVWVVEPFPASGTVVDWPPDAPVTARLRVDGRDGQDFVLPGGESLDDGLWVFDGEDCEGQPGRLRLISCGSVRSRRRRLFVSLPAGGRYVVEEGELVEAVPLELPGRSTLLCLTVPVRLSERGSDLSISLRPASETDGAVRLTVAGSCPRWRTDAPAAVSGQPRIWISSADGTVREAAPGSLRWRHAGRGSWEAWRSDLPNGMLDVAAIRDGALAASIRLARFPAGCRVMAEPKGNAGGAVRFLGFDGAWIGLSGDAPPGVGVTVETGGGQTAMTFHADGPPPSELSVEARWDGGAPTRFRVPFPVRGGGFVDAKGRWLAPGATLPMDGLHGVRAKASAGGRAMLFADLQGGDAATARRLFLRETFEDEAPLSQFRQAFVRLLSNSGIDAAVRLIVQTGGADSREVRVARFDAGLAREGNGFVVSGAGDGIEQEVVARSVDNPGAAEIPLFREEQVWTFPESSGPGPWLVYGRVDGRHRVRPTILALGSREADEPSRGLASAILIAKSEERAQALDRCLEAMADDPTGDDWLTVDGALDALSGKLPFAVWDTFSRLAKSPAALQAYLTRCTSDRVARAYRLEDEYPFMWALLPLEGWERAFREVHVRRRDGFVAAGVPAELAEDTAGMLIDDTFQCLVDVDPAMHGVVAVVAERLGRRFGGQPPPSAFGEALLSALLAEARQAAQKRNADERNLPDGHDFRETMRGLPDEHLLVSEHARPLLDAPFTAARLAVSGNSPNRETFLALRQCRDFDPGWFEAAFPPALALECLRAKRA